MSTEAARRRARAAYAARVSATHKRLELQVPNDLHAALKDEAHAQGITPQAFILNLLSGSV